MNRINGDNPHSEIIRNFSNPETGAFDPNSVSNFLNYIEQGVNSEDPQEREQAITSQIQWRNLTKYIKNDAMVSKYNTLITKAYYMPKALAEIDFNDNNIIRKVAYFGAKYALVSDEEATPTDADYETYYQAHKNEYKNKQESRKIDYIVWDVRPSDSDVNELEKQINEYGHELQSAEASNVQYIVNRVGENRYDSTWVKRGSLSPFIDSAAFTAEIGTVLGPWPENNAFHVARVMSREIRPDSMKASHILISYSGAYGAGAEVSRTKIGASSLADSLKNEIIKNPASFDQLVSLSDDPSAIENNGVFDWFADGTMIPEFNKACIVNPAGTIVVVETTFGFHVLRVDGKKDESEKIRIAQIDLPITFSQETFNEAYSKAIKFAAVNQTYEAFDTASTNMGLNVMKGDFVNKMSAGVQWLKNSRDIVKWMFEDNTNKGSISTVFDFENKVVVAALVDINPEGILPLENIKEQIKVLVTREVKGRILSERMQSVKDLNQASEYDAKIDTANLSFATYSLQMYGPEQSVIGYASTADVNQLVGPIVGEQGVFFFKVLEAGEAPAEKDLKFTQERSYNNFIQRVNSSAYQALEDNAVIEDFLYFFY
jgi:peptidyl-prolyl cis-trans isomerase D